MHISLKVGYNFYLQKNTPTESLQYDDVGFFRLAVLIAKMNVEADLAPES